MPCQSYPALMGMAATSHITHHKTLACLVSQLILLMMHVGDSIDGRTRDTPILFTFIGTTFLIVYM